MSRHTLGSGWVASQFDSGIHKRHGELSASGEPPAPSSSSWFVLYQPQSETDLCVQKKKLDELNGLLALRSGIVLATGPPGSGKTAAIRSCCEARDITLKEWVSPMSTDVYDPSTSFPALRSSQVARFEDFLLRADRYSDLCAGQSNVGRKILLVEDLPNVFVWHPSAFRETLKKFAATGRHLLLFVISNEEGNSLVRDLFPAELQRELGIRVISFNPVSNTNMQKALYRILRLRDIPVSGKAVKAVVSKITEEANGDLRSAINSLQFELNASGSKLASGAKHNEQIGAGDHSLDMFHALGKVLYGKRATEKQSERSLPAHLQNFYRRMLTFVPEEIIEKSKMSPDLFVLFLHGNLLKFVPDIDTYSDIMSDFSRLDALQTNNMDVKDILEVSRAGACARSILFHNDQTDRGRKWTPLHKPAYLDHRKSLRKNMTAMFQELQPVWLDSSPEALSCDVLPYAAYLPLLMAMDVSSRQLVQRLGIIDVRRDQVKQDLVRQVASSSVPVKASAATKASIDSADTLNDVVVIDDFD